MEKPIDHYALIAGIFEYPTADLPDKTTALQTELDRRYPSAGEMLRPFSRFVARASVLEMEELFVRSFDVQAITTLDIGYVLFGDDYKRGELLVNLNREHQAVDNDCFDELSDHLPNILRLLPKLRDGAITHELVEKVIAPALKKMIAEFGSDRIKAKEKSYQKHYKTLIDRSQTSYTIYLTTLKSLYEILKQDFGFEEFVIQDKHSSDFLKSINTEMATESGEMLQKVREDLERGKVPM